MFDRRDDVCLHFVREVTSGIDVRGKVALGLQLAERSLAVREEHQPELAHDRVVAPIRHGRAAS